MGHTNLLARAFGARQAIELGHSQVEMDGLLDALQSQAKDWKSLLSMTMSAGAFRLARLAALERLHFPAARVLSTALALGAESAAFGQSQRLLARLAGEESAAETWQSFWARSLDFGVLRAAGHLFPISNPFLGNQARAHALALCQILEEKSGLAAASGASYAQRVLHASLQDVGFQMGQSLFASLSGGRVGISERLQDLRIQALESSRASSRLRAAESILERSAAPSEEALIWPRALPPEAASFYKDLALQQRLKRFEGLLDYYREVAQKPQASQHELDHAFLSWMGLGHPELGIGPDDVSQRAFYLFIRSLDARQKGHELQARWLPAFPDAAGTPLNTHAEIHSLRGLQPKAAVFLLTGYGETLPMQDPLIDHFLGRNYAVVAVETRGHGFSGHPLGVEGYMGSLRETMGDLQVAVEKLRSEPRLKDLPWFGFGFSQGGLFHTLLAQANPLLYRGLALLSPTHALGKRFDFVLVPQLEASGRQRGDYLGLDPSSRSRANPEGNLVAQDFTRFGSTPAREAAQKWLNRGFAPPYFILKDSSVLWAEGIDAALARADRNGSLEVPAFVVIGEKDGNIGGPKALVHTRHLVAHPREWILEGRDHQLLLEGEGLPEEILARADAFFDQVLASGLRPEAFATLRSPVIERLSDLSMPASETVESLFEPDSARPSLLVRRRWAARGLFRQLLLASASRLSEGQKNALFQSLSPQEAIERAVLGDAAALERAFILLCANIDTYSKRPFPESGKENADHFLGEIGEDLQALSLLLPRDHPGRRRILSALQSARATLSANPSLLRNPEKRLKLLSVLKSWASGSREDLVLALLERGTVDAQARQSIDKFYREMAEDLRPERGSYGSREVFALMRRIQAALAKHLRVEAGASAPILNIGGSIAHGYAKFSEGVFHSDLDVEFNHPSGLEERDKVRLLQAIRAATGLILDESFQSLHPHYKGLSNPLSFGISPDHILLVVNRQHEMEVPE